MSGPERIVVALTGGPEGEVLLRRAAGIAARSPGAELHSVYVVRPGPGGASDPAGLARLRRLTEDLGGTPPHGDRRRPGAGGARPAPAASDATQVVVGQSRHGRVRSALRAGVSERVVAEAGELDVLMVGHPYARGAPGPRPASPLGTGRRVAGWLLAVGGPLLLTACGRRVRRGHPPRRWRTSRSPCSAPWSAACGRPWSPRCSGACC